MKSDGLSVRTKRKAPSFKEDLFVKIASGAFITLTSLIWIPLWILLLPSRRRRERRKREERLAQAALWAKMPPPPPAPPTDPELLRRCEIARLRGLQKYRLTAKGRALLENLHQTS